MLSNAQPLIKRRLVIVGIMALIAAAHIFPLRSYLPGALANYYASYFSDLVIPFGGYFLVCLASQQLPPLKRWEARLALSFLVPALAETCQYFGVPVLGATFDPLDYAMYGLGVLAAAIVETQVFPRLFAFWTEAKR